MYSNQMLATHPNPTANSTLSEALDALYACAQACTSCADACLGEEQVAELKRCITLNLDCADVCIASGSVLTRQTEANRTLERKLMEACIEACRRCAEECERHASMHEHCRICAEACRACEERCREVLQAVTA